MERTYSEKDLISFGNYLLSEERNNHIENEEMKNVVGDWDMANWKQGKYINIGDQFLCIQDVIMDDNGELCYKEGDIYTSECDGCITNLQGDKNHGWEDVEYFNEYFKKLK